MSMNGGMLARANVREASITAVVTRADGRVETLGVISYWHRNPLKRFAVNAMRKLKEIRNDRTRAE